MIKFFKPQKKYRINDSTIDWTYIGLTSNNRDGIYTFVDEVNCKRKQYKQSEIKELNIKRSNDK